MHQRPLLTLSGMHFKKLMLFYESAFKSGVPFPQAKYSYICHLYLVNWFTLILEKYSVLEVEALRTTMVFRIIMTLLSEDAPNEPLDLQKNYFYEKYTQTCSLLV